MKDEYRIFINYRDVYLVGPDDSVILEADRRSGELDFDPNMSVLYYQDNYYHTYFTLEDLERSLQYSTTYISKVRPVSIEEYMESGDPYNIKEAIRREIGIKNILDNL